MDRITLRLICSLESMRTISTLLRPRPFGPPLPLLEFIHTFVYGPYNTKLFCLFPSAENLPDRTEVIRRVCDGGKRSCRGDVIPLGAMDDSLPPRIGFLSKIF